MSRQPSPGPSQASARPPFFQPAPAAPPPPPRQKSKAYSSGIAAGAEDVKYAAKYRDLKRKVKEIETDNDKLLFKVLQAKRNIQRAKLERAILYERLAAIPASPPASRPSLPPPPAPHAHAPPPPHTQPPLPPHTAHKPAQLVVQVDTRHGLLQVVAGPDGRPLVGPDGRYVPAHALPMGPGVAPPPAPHAHAHGHGHGRHAHPRESFEPPPPHLARSRSSQPHGHRERERDWERERHAHPHAPPADAPARRHDLHELAGAHAHTPQLPSPHAHSSRSPADARFARAPTHAHTHHTRGAGQAQERARIPTPPFARLGERAPLEDVDADMEQPPPAAPPARRGRERDAAPVRRRSHGAHLSDLVNAEPVRGTDAAAPMDVDGGAPNGLRQPAAAGMESGDRSPKRNHVDRTVSPDVGPQELDRGNGDRA